MAGDSVVFETFCGFFILFAPLAGALFSACFAFSPKRLIAGIVPSALLLMSTLVCAFLLYRFYTADIGIGLIRLYIGDWIVAGEFFSGFNFELDFVSLVMASVVNLVSACVHIYSIGYMAHDKGFNRYFAFLSAFVFSMLFLVMSDNLLGLFIGWEGVGLCSYLLIGFFYHKQSAIFASNEAFIMNRIADLAMLLGIFFIASTADSIYFRDILPLSADLAHSSSPNAPSYEQYKGFLWGGALLFVGAMGKSAQFPFHTWLADAMEGPTPVSALIHAATMVTAGVYLVLRLDELYWYLFDVRVFITYLGAFVALFAASMALVNRDLKRIIAYSTLSQLGYMFVAAGLGMYWIAFFHLVTHAFFKALLFLGAGNVMHACNDELDITKMGGLYKPLRATFVFMFVASLALCGVFPFAGYFSKDLILESAFYTQHFGLWIALLVGAFFTAFYSFRLLMLVFAPRKQAQQSTQHAHEAPNLMLFAMLPLGILAVVAGFFEEYFATSINPLLPELSLEPSDFPHYYLIAITTIVVFGGIAFAIGKYKNGFNDSQPSVLYKLLFHQYYIPKIYEKCIIIPYQKIATFLWQRIECRVIDNIVDSLARMLAKGGEYGKATQSGDLSQSLRLMVFGVFVFLTLMLVGLWEVLSA